MDGSVLIKEHTYEVFDEHLITLGLFKMPGRSALLWIGNNDLVNTGKLINLTLAINGNSSNIIGNEEISTLVNSLSIRLGDKFNGGAPLYLSYNLSGAAFSSKQFIIKIEEIINEFMSKECEQNCSKI